MKRFFVILLTSLISFSSYAQQDLFNESPIVSPEINADRSVTFRIQAPLADSVSISGSLDAQHAFAPITYDMKKENDSIWSFSSPVLPSELYRYHFTVDGEIQAFEQLWEYS